MADTILHGDDRHLEEERGDLLLQVVLHALMACEEGRFDLAGVARCITSKLIRRHPHVFASEGAEEGWANCGVGAESEAVRCSWQAVKAEIRSQQVQQD